MKPAGLGTVFVAPFDVQLAEDTVVQPDVIVVLNANKAILHDSRIIGAPDLVVEVSSPGTATHDRRKKYDAYAKAGVREYWLADPASHSVEIRILEDGDYKLLGIFKDQSTLLSTVVPEIDAVRVDLLFASK